MSFLWLSVPFARFCVGRRSSLSCGIPCIFSGLVVLALVGAVFVGFAEALKNEYVTCGSVISLQGQHERTQLACKEVTYGGRGSGQNACTGVAGSAEPDRYFVVRGIADDGAEPCLQGTLITKGKKLRLQHMASGRWLHSHHITSMISNNQEVSERAQERDREGQRGRLDRATAAPSAQIYAATRFSQNPTIERVQREGGGGRKIAITFSLSLACVAPWKECLTLPPPPRTHTLFSNLSPSLAPFAFSFPLILFWQKIRCLALVDQMIAMTATFGS